MKINGVNNVPHVYNKNNNVKKTEEKPKVIEDKVTISNEAKAYHFAMKKLNDIPEIRTEKVNEIRAQIKSGTYKVDSNKIAQKMMDNVSFDKKI